MFDKLEDLVLRYEELMNELNDPDVVNDQKSIPENYERAERPCTDCRSL